MAHQINGIKLTVYKWTLNEKYEVDNHSKLVTLEITGETAEEAMFKLRQMSYNNDLSKYSPLEIISVSEF